MLYVTPQKFADADGVINKAGNIYLERVLTFKYMGITLDTELKSPEQIDIIHEKAFRKLTEVAPRMPEAWDFLGMALSAQGKHDDAAAAKVHARTLRV